MCSQRIVPIEIASLALRVDTTNLLEKDLLLIIMLNGPECLGLRSCGLANLG